MTSTSCADKVVTSETNHNVADIATIAGNTINDGNQSLDENRPKKRGRPVGSTVRSKIDVDNGTNNNVADITTITGNASNDGNQKVDEKRPRKRGRPKGSTLQNKAERQQTKIKCINEISQLYKEELENNRSSGDNSKRTKYGFLESLIESKWTEYGLYQYPDTAVPVSTHTIRSRIRGKTLAPIHRGTASPLAELEGTILDKILQMARNRQHMSVAAIIDYTNSLINGSEFEDRLIKFKSIHNADLPVENAGRVGQGWWIGFYRRHKGTIESKKGIIFEREKKSSKTK